MITVRELYDWLDGFAPFSTQLEFDNAGLLVGDAAKPVRRVGIALDLTADTVRQAAALGCELVVSHHPVIFTPLRALPADSPVYLLAREGIAAICAHTNLDAAAGGVNDALCAALGLQNCALLADPETPDAPAMARVGTLPPQTPQGLARYVKERLGCGGVKYMIGAAEITRAAVCGGAGGDLIRPALQAGAQALVTGECRHHERLLAKSLGLTLIEAGHFCTEQVVKSAVQTRLRAAFPSLDAVLLEETDCAAYC